MVTSDAIITLGSLHVVTVLDTINWSDFSLKLVSTADYVVDVERETGVVVVVSVCVCM